MKKLPTFCAVVVFLAAFAYQADATIVTLTKDIGTPGTLKAIEFNRLADYDLTAENDITLSNILGANFGSLTCDGSDLAGYNPIIDITISIFDEDSSARNDTLDAVYVRDNIDLILPTIPAAMPGGLILEDKGFPEYNPMPDISTLFYYKDLFAVSNILIIVYLRNNDGIILTTSRAIFSSLIFRDFDLPYYNPISNIAILFFDEELFTGNQLFDMVNFPGNNIIPSAASDAALEDLTFENRGTIEYNHPTNITALYLGESIFANIGNFYFPTDGFANPEPTSIVILGLGSLYLLRKRRNM